MEPRPGIPTNIVHAIALFLLDILFRVLNRLEVFGQENIPPPEERGILILSNHISTLDPFLIGVTAMPRFSKVWWRAAAKDELFKNTFSGWVMNLIGAFPVKRGQHDAASMDRMVASLKTDVLVVFPEGTWSKGGKLLPGRAGVGRVIFRSRPSRIIPVAVKGTDDILPQKSWIPRVGRRAKIIFGSPLRFDALYERPDDLETAKEIVNGAMKEIERLYSSLGD